MRPSTVFVRHREEIRRIVLRHSAADVRVFGSVLSGTDREGSDLDLLVDPTDGMTLFDIGAIRQELSDLLGVPVEVVTPGALPDRFRGQVMKEAEPV